MVFDGFLLEKSGGSMDLVVFHVFPPEKSEKWLG